MEDARRNLAPGPPAGLAESISSSAELARSESMMLSNRAQLWQEWQDHLRRVETITGKRFRNPASGGPVMPTIDCYMQLLPKGLETETLQSSAAWIYSVVEGTGKTIVGDTTIAWGPRDVFVVPGWYPHHHQADGDAFVFSFKRDALILAFSPSRGRV